MPTQQTRQRILGAARLVLQQHGIAHFTTGQVARQAGTAKGLVHYHFGTKANLLAATVRDVAGDRDLRWRGALARPTPAEAIYMTWEQVQAPGDRLWLALAADPGADPEVRRTIRELAERFAGCLTDGIRDLLDGAGLEPTVVPDQLGWLLHAVVEGSTAQLAAGIPAEVVQESYAAAWLGILSLTR